MSPVPGYDAVAGVTADDKNQTKQVSARTAKTTVARTAVPMSVRAPVSGVTTDDKNQTKQVSARTTKTTVARTTNANVVSPRRADATSKKTGTQDTLKRVKSDGARGGATRVARTAKITSSQDIKTSMSTMNTRTEMTSFCKAQYTECMDNFCNVLDDNQGRCSCSKNVKNYEKTEAALKEATEALQDVAQQIQYIGLTKYDIETLFSQTEAELQMQNTTDNSQIKNSLDKIKGLIVDVKPGTASTTDVTDGLSMDLSGLLDFNIGSAGFDIGSLFGSNTANTSSISNQRGEQLYKTAASRCKTAVLKDCQAQGVDISVVSNAYDMEIDKQCVAYERYLTESNDEMKQTVRNAKSVLQRARLMVAQQKNTYDLRGCINALDSCMQDDYVCGSDYENCLDPSGKYIVNGEIVIGSTPGQAVPDTGSVSLGAGSIYSTDGMYSIWNYYKDNKKYNAWGGDTRNKVAEGSLNEYVNLTLLSNYPTDTGTTLSQYLQHKIGYIEDGKSKGMCSSVLGKCQDYTFVKGKYVSDNRVIRDYLTRTMTLIKRAQDEKLADHAETCISDVSSCLGENNYESNRNIAINACRAMIKTCMSVNGNAGANPTPDAIISWVNGIMGRPGGETSGGSSGGGSNDDSGDGGANERPDTATYITLTFSGASVDDKKCEAGGVYTLPDAPKQEGYAFGGWSINGQTYAAGDNISCSSDVLGVSSGTATITAQWLKNGITLTFNTDGGTRVYDSGCAYGDTFIFPPVTRTGYAFKWWELNNKHYSAGDKVTCTSDVLGVSSGTATITAQWSAMSIELYYNTDGTQDEYAGECTYDKTLTLQAAPTREGYTFGGWDVNGQTYAAGQQVACTKNILGVDNGSVTITAHWLNNAILLTYNTDGGTSVLSAECTYGGTFTLPSAPTRTGYTFLGWLIRDGDYNDYEPGAQISCTKDTLGVDGDTAVIRADWSLNRITLTYNTDGGSDVTGGAACTYGNTFTLPTASTREGYTFDGWDVNGKTYAAGNQVNCTKDELGVDVGTVTITANWTRDNVGQTITLIYDANGGSDVEPSSCTYDDTFTLPSAPTLTGYTFGGWSVNGETYTARQQVNCTEDILGVDNGTVTIKASWSPQQVKLIYNTNGGSVVPDDSCTYGNRFMLPAAPTRSGYKFVRWKINGKSYIAYQSIDCNYDVFGAHNGTINVESEWTKCATKKIVYHNDNNGLDTYDCNVGDTIQLLGNYSTGKCGYLVYRWSIPALGTSLYTPGKSLVCDADWPDTVNIYPEYSPHGINYMFKSEPDWVGDSCTYDYSVTPPSAPTRSGYVFGGWNINGTIYDQDEDIDCNFNVFGVCSTDRYEYIYIDPVWIEESKIGQITLYFHRNNGSAVVAGGTCTYGDKITLPSAPTRDGYTFDGWVVGGRTYPADATIGCTFAGLGRSSGVATIVARWKDAVMPRTVAVQYPHPEIVGEIADTDTCVYGSYLQLPADPGYPGYTFEGWYINGTDTLYAASQKIACDFSGTVSIDPKLTGNKITIHRSAGAVPDLKLDDKTCTYGLKTLYLGMLLDPAERMRHTGWRITNPDGTHVWTNEYPQDSWDCDYYNLGVYSGDTYAEAIWKNFYMSVTYEEDLVVRACNIGETYTFPDAPTKEGYTFAGWRIGNKDTIYNPGDVIDCTKKAMGADHLTTTLTAVWK